MDTARFIAARLRYKGVIAMVAIAISFFVIILAQSISSGFRHELREAVASVTGDVTVVSQGSDIEGSGPLGDRSVLEEAILSSDGVASVTPAVYRAGIVKGREELAGVIFKGTPDGPDSLRVSIPSSLADLLYLKEGDDFPAYFVGDRVRTRRFRVASVYDDLLRDGNMVVFAGLSDMQRLNSWREDQVSALEIRLKDDMPDRRTMEYRKSEIGARLLALAPEDGPAPLALSAASQFPDIFAWLDLVDRNVLMILVLMTIVAGFNMISGLLILLFRNISTIGTLKALGMTDLSISAIFLRVSSSLVLKGMGIGNALALLFCMLQGSTHMIRLNPENYYVSFVPVHLNPAGILLADLSAYLVIMLLLLIPSLYVSRVDPALTVRAK